MALSFPKKQTTDQCCEREQALTSEYKFQDLLEKPGDAC